jgi:hypothetical protein
MKDDCLWRMFCETGEPACYLLYKEATKDKERIADFPPLAHLAFCGDEVKPVARI